MTDMYCVPLIVPQGTVWMQQILVQIVNSAHPKWADEATNRAQVPFLEAILADEPLQDMTDPRILYTHLPPDMIPRGVKEKQIKVPVFCSPLCFKY